MAVKQFSQARTAAPTGEPPAPSAVSIDLALSILYEHFEQLAALSFALEGRLADECERVKDGGPLIDWRLAQVLNDMLSSTKVQRDVACLLGREMAGQEP